LIFSSCTDIQILEFSKTSEIEEDIVTTAARRSLLLYLVVSLLLGLAAAQSTRSQSSVVPRLVNFSGKAIDGGKVTTGVAGATFSIYGEQFGGSPLWLETQNIQADARGNYTVQLGATKPEGLPLDLFTSGEARQRSEFIFSSGAGVAKGISRAFFPAVVPPSASQQRGLL
jgi:hypothetical protein